jgi:hypothetical protein
VIDNGNVFEVLMDAVRSCSLGQITARAVRGRRAVPAQHVELIGIAGGDDIFPERAACAMGRDRILADPLEVARRAPDIIVGSWCGKKFRPERVAARPGWESIPAVRDGELHEVKSPIILQPGPAALTDGLDALHAIIGRWAADASKRATAA